MLKQQSLESGVRGHKAGLLIPGQEWQTTPEEPQTHGPEIGLFLGGKPRDLQWWGKRLGETRMPKKRSGE